MSRAGVAVLLAAVVVLLVGHGSAAAAMRVLDDLSDASMWRVGASDDVTARMRRDDDGSLCLDYDFGGVSGYAVLRRALTLSWLPPDYAFVVRMKGSGPANDLQFKLVDESGDNVWWATRPAFALPAVPTDLRLKKRHISFAWGTTKDRELHRVHTIEFVIAAGPGGRGSFCLQRIGLEERDVGAAPPPVATASTTVAGSSAASAIDGRADSAWRAPGGAQTLQIDFGVPREFNGIKLGWRNGERAVDYDVEISDDASEWKTLRQVRGAGGNPDALFLPESEARYVRLKLLRARGARYALGELELPDHRQWPTLNSMLVSLAGGLPRGHMPRAFLGEQNYWTLMAVDGGGARSALMSEDGAIEIGRGGFSVEPSLHLEDGKRVAWADVQIGHALREGYLPMPSVQWRHARFTLDIEAAADGPRDAPFALARYTLRNLTDRALPVMLSLAVRPWQVNPPQQFLSTPGGATWIATLRRTDDALQIAGRSALRATQAPTAMYGATFDSGALHLDRLERAPLRTALDDPVQLASGALDFRIVLPPRGTRRIGWVAPLAGDAVPARITQAQLDARFEQVAQHWRERLNRARVRVPPQAQLIADTLRTSLAHVLMSRDGPALRPGTRSYARTWVRDGAMMVAGLLQLGEVAASREFVDWYAGHIFANGKVPCCVDARGSDPVAENDSHGEYLYAVAEIWRHTRDTAWLARHWENVQRVTGYMEELRQSQRTQPGALCFGLMPPSISHEGYYDKPACSYWDDFWALRGYKDAVEIARALGHEPEATRWESWRDEFTRELVASIEVAGAHHKIDFIPGAADRGDFDATSTTIALNPAQAQQLLPPARLAATFERYWREAEARASGKRDWKDYTPYELRNVGALVRLGQSDRAHALLRFFFADQRPRGWNQWAEVVRALPREVQFLGDMPHAWVSSDYIRTVLDLFAYEREHDQALILAAGVPLEWLERDGVDISGLSTRFGPLSYRLVPNGAGWTLDVGSGLQGLKGGLRLVWPGTGPLPKATLDGRALTWVGRELPLPAAPAQVTLARQ